MNEKELYFLSPQAPSWCAGLILLLLHTLANQSDREDKDTDSDSSSVQQKRLL
jgi:hypothetical protein